MPWAEESVVQHIPQFAAEGCARYFTGADTTSVSRWHYTTCWRVSDAPSMSREIYGVYHG
jgi:hypothetical protein